MWNVVQNARSRVVTIESEPVNLASARRERTESCQADGRCPHAACLSGPKFFQNFSQLCDNSHLRDVQPDFLERVQFCTWPLPRALHHPWIEIHTLVSMIEEGGIFRIDWLWRMMICKELINFFFHELATSNLMAASFFEDFWNCSRYRLINKKNRKVGTRMFAFSATSGSLCSRFDENIIRIVKNSYEFLGRSKARIVKGKCRWSMFVCSITRALLFCNHSLLRYSAMAFQTKSNNTGIIRRAKRIAAAIPWIIKSWKEMRDCQ